MHGRPRRSVIMAGTMNRRHLLHRVTAAAALGTSVVAWLLTSRSAAGAARSRVRPGTQGWPSDADWQRLARAVGGRLVKVRSPLEGCVAAQSGPDCALVLRQLKNPYYLGDEVGLTQTLGWVDA